MHCTNGNDYTLFISLGYGHPRRLIFEQNGQLAKHSSNVPNYMKRIKER